VAATKDSGRTANRGEGRVDHGDQIHPEARSLPLIPKTRGGEIGCGARAENYFSHCNWR
jgi:hypothetical protein